MMLAVIDRLSAEKSQICHTIWYTVYIIPMVCGLLTPYSIDTRG